MTACQKLDLTALNPSRKLTSQMSALLFKHLNEKERVVIQYYYYEGLSMREIAGMLRLTESRVCQIHSKVIRRLRDQHATKKAELFA